MPRKPRLNYPGAFYHLLNRGNQRQPIFQDEQDVAGEPFSHHPNLTKSAEPVDERRKSIGADQGLIAGGVRLSWKNQKVKCGTNWLPRPRLIDTAVAG